MMQKLAIGLCGALILINVLGLGYQLGLHIQKERDAQLTIANTHFEKSFCESGAYVIANCRKLIGCGTGQSILYDEVTEGDPRKVYCAYSDNGD